MLCSGTHKRGVICWRLRRSASCREPSAHLLEDIISCVNRVKSLNPNRFYPEQIFATVTFLLAVTAEKCLQNRPRHRFFVKSDSKCREVLPIIFHYSSHYSFCVVSAPFPLWPRIDLLEKRLLTSTFKINTVRLCRMEGAFSRL